jgi:hypothetical protein
MDLMEKFELCFEFEGERGHYLIPELLGKEEPESRAEFPPEHCLNFQYHYNILPEGLIPRFIVRTHHLSRDLPRWRTGVVLEFEGNRALVRADVPDRKVFISVAGPEAGRRGLLTLVRGHFDHIHRSIARLQADEKVPVPGRPHVVLDYRKLLVREANGRTNVELEDSDEVVSLDLRRLLDGIESPEARALRPKPKPPAPTSPQLTIPDGPVIEPHQLSRSELLKLADVLSVSDRERLTSIADLLLNDPNYSLFISSPRESLFGEKRGLRDVRILLVMDDMDSDSSELISTLVRSDFPLYSSDQLQAETYWLPLMSREAGEGGQFVQVLP